MDKFEEAFKQLKKEGKTSVDDIIAWMRETKLVEETKEAEEKARKLFADMAHTQTVELEKFKQAIDKLAKDQQKSIDDFTKLLAEQGPRLANAFAAGASAFKEAFKKK